MTNPTQLKVGQHKKGLGFCRTSSLTSLFGHSPCCFEPPLSGCSAPPLHYQQALRSHRARRYIRITHSSMTSEWAPSLSSSLMYRYAEEGEVRPISTNLDLEISTYNENHSAGRMTFYCFRLQPHMPITRRAEFHPGRGHFARLNSGKLCYVPTRPGYARICT